MEERTYVRTLYGRSDGSDVITKPKFIAVMGLPKSLSYGAPLARALRRAQELRYNSTKSRHVKSCKQHLSVDQPVVLTWGNISSCKVLICLLVVRIPLFLNSVVSGSVRPLIYGKTAKP